MTDKNPVTENSRELYPHNKAVNQYYFTGELHLQEALHIGSGWGDATTDALVVADGQGKPFIPGSSLRGVFRSEVERLLAGLEEIDGTLYWACQLYESVLPKGKTCLGNQVNPESKDVYLKLLKDSELHGQQYVWEQVQQGLCDACRLFGAGTFWASKVRFIDLVLKSKKLLKIRHGVGIHRDTGTAAPAIKYDRQVVEAGSIFAFEIVAENLDKVDLALLALGMSRLNSGELPLGGGTTRGLGGCKLEGVQVYSVNFQEPKSLRKYLTHQKLEDRYDKYLSLDEFIKENIAGLFASSTEDPAHA